MSESPRLQLTARLSCWWRRTGRIRGRHGNSVRLNEHAVSYAVGKGKVLELSEPVIDPETFAQDIRRLLGTQNVLMSLWNGLTTIAVPYSEHGRTVKVLESC